jgi:3D (Asp-Asp-Asp) domain-containing protein
MPYVKPREESETRAESGGKRHLASLIVATGVVAATVVACSSATDLSKAPEKLIAREDASAPVYAADASTAPEDGGGGGNGGAANDDGGRGEDGAAANDDGGEDASCGCTEETCPTGGDTTPSEPLEPAYALPDGGTMPPATGIHMTFFCPGNNKMEGGCMGQNNQPICPIGSQNGGTATCQGKTITCNHVSIACDPSVYPMGTCGHLWVTNPNGNKSQIAVCCDDTGGDINGNHIDIAVPCGCNGHPVKGWVGGGTLY